MGIFSKEKIFYNLCITFFFVILIFAGTLAIGEDAFADITTTPPANYITFSSSETFTIQAPKKWAGTLYYSTSETTWTVWNGEVIEAAPTLADSHELYMCGTGNTVITGMYTSAWAITGTNVSCTGNIETLLDYSTVDSGGEPTMGEYCFHKMFENCTSLVAAPVLSATNLAPYCYQYMFYGCSSLTQAPALPALTLANSCYLAMFGHCTNLTQAPALPAMSLAYRCYSNMFIGCKKMEQAPTLPATTLADSCYEAMFQFCEALKQAPALPALTLKPKCYAYMFVNCGKITQAPELPATNLASECYSVMFNGCGGLTQTPKLHATTLANECYSGMFGSCVNIKEMPELPATVLVSGCYFRMFNGSGIEIKDEPEKGYRKPFVISHAGSGTFSVNPVQEMFGTHAISIGVPFYVKSKIYSATVSTPVNNGTISADNISNGKCESYDTITFTLTPNDGYALKNLYYTENNDEESAKHYITLSNGQYKLTMPEKDITIVCEFDEIVAEINGEYYFDDNIKSGIQLAVTNGYIVKLLASPSETDIAIENGKILYINFNGISWNSVVTLDTENVVGIKAPGQGSGLYSSIGNIRATNNINHTSTDGSNKAAQCWLDLDGDGYVNESDVSALREKFETVGMIV